MSGIRSSDSLSLWRLGFAAILIVTLAACGTPTAAPAAPTAVPVEARPTWAPMSRPMAR